MRKERLMKNDITESLVAFSAFTLLFGILAAGLLWADHRERELGIDGMSSERMLVIEEMKNK